MAKEKIKYNRLGAVMEEEEVKNKDLADHLGITPHAVSRWRTNDQQPTMENLFRAAEYLHRDVRDLLVPNKLPDVPVRKKQLR